MNKYLVIYADVTVLQQARDIPNLVNITESQSPFRHSSEILAVLHFGSIRSTFSILNAHLNH